MNAKQSLELIAGLSQHVLTDNDYTTRYRLMSIIESLATEWEDLDYEKLRSEVEAWEESLEG